jgi:VanZ family protein
MRRIEKVHRYIFWIGYLLVFAESFVTLKVDLHKITFGGPSFKFHLDQIFHAIVYFLICMYFLFGEFLGLRLFKNNSFLKFLVVILVLATVTEGVQAVVPERSWNAFDWVANIVGIVIGVLVISTVRRKAEWQLASSNR